MKEKFKIFFKALLTTLALTLNLVSIYKGKIEDTFLVELYTIFVILFLLYQFYLHEEKNINKKVNTLSILFSIFLLFGYSYLKIDSWDLIFGNFYMFIISIFLFFGYFFLFQILISFIERYLLKIEWKNITSKKNKIFKSFLQKFEEHPMKVSFIVLILCWLIYVIAFYPIILSPDPSFQIKMYFNVHTKYIDWVIPRSSTVFMTTHHPVIHTFLLGFSIEIGRILGSDNFGLFLYSIMQTTTLALTLSYTIYYMKKLNMKNSARLLLLGIYAFVPMFPFYAMSGVKDTFYTCFVIIYTIFLFDLYLFKKNKELSWMDTIKMIFVILLLMLFRNNGIYVVFFSFPFLFLFKYFDRKKLAIIFSFSFVLYFSFTKILVPFLGISDGSIREALSIPFQQTARYVKYHENDLTTEEKRIIDKVLDYKDLKERYDPELADDVKNKYNKYTTSEDLKKYFGVWFNGFLKHPDTYIEATINNTYGYFYPNSLKWYIYSKFNNGITENNLVDYHYNDLTILRDVLTAYGGSFQRIPGIGLISNIGFSSWVLFFLTYLLIHYKKKNILLSLLPLFVSLLVCIASPANTYFRYAMPYIFMMPFLLLIILHIIKEDFDYEKE